MQTNVDIIRNVAYYGSVHLLQSTPIGVLVFFKIILVKVVVTHNLKDSLVVIYL